MAESRDSQLPTVIKTTVSKGSYEWARGTEMTASVSPPSSSYGARIIDRSGEGQSFFSAHLQVVPQMSGAFGIRKPPALYCSVLVCEKKNNKKGWEGDMGERKKKRKNATCVLHCTQKWTILTLIRHLHLITCHPPTCEYADLRYAECGVTTTPARSPGAD